MLLRASTALLLAAFACQTQAIDRLTLQVGEISLSNEAGTFVIEKVGAVLQARLTRAGKGYRVQADIQCNTGQTLAGPVLLDFAANPLQAQARGTIAGGLLTLDAVKISQKDLLAAHGMARVRMGAQTGQAIIPNARLDIDQLQFPAAYTSFLQIALAATGLGTLQTTGTARGTVELADDAVARLAVKFTDIDLQDEKKRFSMDDLRGDLHWAASGTDVVESSYLAWSHATALGLSGGTARLDLRAHGLDFELIHEARLPVFDGALAVHSLAVRHVGTPEMEMDFDAHIDPISMPLLSHAFGWPELSGQLGGRIPGLTYRNRLLTFNGDVTANVFDGVVTGSRFRLQDPLGPWPRLLADVTARRLDLELVTHTFSIGSITGRLDADLKSLELFNWSPVAFDARLYSTPGDRSKHLISQKAVSSLSSVGGGGGAVTRTLQSGVLRFFENFRYDRIGLSCRLRDDVCVMAGIEPHAQGYYIVKGKGIPRIDIVGNAGRVDWPQLVTQIVQGMRSESVIVR